MAICSHSEYQLIISFVDAQQLNTGHCGSPTKAMARIPLPSEVQEDEGCVSTDGALQKIQTTRLY